MDKTLAFIFGTRPEAIKMAPLIKSVQAGHYSLRALVVITGQHREILDQVLTAFNIKADYDLNVMQPSQVLTDVTVKVLQELDKVLNTEPVDMVMVQGDTVTTFAGALAAFYHRIPVSHVEAGLRTKDKYSPFPEEINRRITTVLADYHFAPTLTAKRNLVKEGIAEERIFVTGNTIVDALLSVLNLPCEYDRSVLKDIDSRRRIVLVTVHRRESFGAPLVSVCKAIRSIVQTIADVEIVFPVHPNPVVRKTVYDQLDSIKRIHLVEPMGYIPFVHLMNKSYLILTDSGGIQEEAPYLNKPVLVLRNTTERTEAIEAGTAILVSTNEDTIIKVALKLLRDNSNYQKILIRAKPYGDGKASEKILKIISSILNKSGLHYS